MHAISKLTPETLPKITENLNRVKKIGFGQKIGFGSGVWGLGVRGPRIKQITNTFESTPMTIFDARALRSRML